jgi:sorbitol/mannitol transport system substrate-binding protein
VYGICLRGKAGWGENMAFLSTLINTNGGRWFDEKWHPTIDSPEWKKSVGFYVDLLQKYGPPGASTNGFNENLTCLPAASAACGLMPPWRPACCSTPRNRRWPTRWALPWPPPA